jgi:hypothetical protein
MTKACNNTRIQPCENRAVSRHSQVKHDRRICQQMATVATGRSSVFAKTNIILSAALVFAAASTVRPQERYPHDDAALVDQYRMATNSIGCCDAAVGLNHGPAGTGKPWPAPVGHRQPQVDDLRIGLVNEAPANDRHGMRQIFEAHDKAIDDAQHSKELDSAMRNICRGC